MLYFRLCLLQLIHALQLVCHCDYNLWWQLLTNNYKNDFSPFKVYGSSPLTGSFVIQFVGQEGIYDFNYEFSNDGRYEATVNGNVQGVVFDKQVQIVGLTMTIILNFLDTKP